MATLEIKKSDRILICNLLHAGAAEYEVMAKDAQDSADKHTFRQRAEEHRTLATSFEKADAAWVLGHFFK